MMKIMVHGTYQIGYTVIKVVQMVLKGVNWVHNAKSGQMVSKGVNWLHNDNIRLNGLERSQLGTQCKNEVLKEVNVEHNDKIR